MNFNYSHSSLLLFVVLVACSINVLFFSTGIVAPANLIEIQTEDKFEEWTQKENHGRATLVYFYAPWSPVCKEFTKQYAKISNWFGKKEYQEQIMITKMDAPKFPRLSRSLGLESFPHVRLYSHEGEVGKYEVYDGELEEHELQNWVVQKLHKKMKREGVPVPKKRKKMAKNKN